MRRGGGGRVPHLLLFLFSSSQSFLSILAQSVLALCLCLLISSFHEAGHAIPTVGDDCLTDRRSVFTFEYSKGPVNQPHGVLRVVYNHARRCHEAKLRKATPHICAPGVELLQMWIF